MTIENELNLFWNVTDVYQVTYADHVHTTYKIGFTESGITKKFISYDCSFHITFNGL